MKYVNAETILPDNLIREIQRYIQGEYIYIPSGGKTRKKWGENSGNREYLRSRNEDIRKKYFNGNTINKLAEEFFLSPDSIRKIIYDKNR